jgi:hypothetical protein
MIALSKYNNIYFITLLLQYSNIYYYYGLVAAAIAFASITILLVDSPQRHKKLNHAVLSSSL